MEKYNGNYVDPVPRCKDKQGRFINRINYSTRVKLEKLLDEGKPIKEIALALNLTRGTIWHERKRCEGKYSADEAEKNVKEKGKALVNQTTKLSLSVHTRVRKVREYICDCLELNNVKSIKKKLDYCRYLLDTLGFKEHEYKPMTNEEKKTIIKLYEEGKSYTEISTIVKRSRTTVHKTVKKIKGGKNYESIKNKWLK